MTPISCRARDSRRCSRRPTVVACRSWVADTLTLTGAGSANAVLKVPALIAGMVAGADSIDDMDLLRHGGMGRLFTGVRAPSTLGTFLRTFTFGHVRQLDGVASRLLVNLAAHIGCVGTDPRPAGTSSPSVIVGGMSRPVASGVETLDCVLVGISRRSSSFTGDFAWESAGGWVAAPSPQGPR